MTYVETLWPVNGGIPNDVLQSRGPETGPVRGSRDIYIIIFPSEINFAMQKAKIANNIFDFPLEYSDLVIVMTNDQFPVQRVDIGPRPNSVSILD